MVRLEWSATEDNGAIWPFKGLRITSTNGEMCRFPLRFRALVEGFALFNPHATFRLDWFGAETMWKATDPAWQKWRPSFPSSAHWYELQHLERLIGAYITHDREAGSDRRVSDFLAEFDGLTGSAKRTKVLNDSGLKRARLSDFVVGDRLDSKSIAGLLAAMKRHTRPVNPRRLGLIGEEHLRERLLGLGCLPESFRYNRKLDDGKSKKLQSATDEKASFLPWIMEAAFGYLGLGADDSRKIFTGANWSTAIKNPFRSFGATGEGLEAHLTDLKAGAHEPIIFVFHLAHPRVEYTDRGKSALIIGGTS